ncbi:MAG: decarboxylating 6-phosphogluconate dehydrogenase [Chloroflexi bacterium]|nr:decarboxylating 6-phosphogluconate dehydrogenase [Chloroflexota bacterium]
MKLGMVGLGKMGAGMAERLRRGSHEVIGYDRNPDVTEVGSLKELLESLEPPRAVWVMVPSGDPTEATLKELAGLASPGDILIDGGNSMYKDSIRRAEELANHGIKFLDVGTSGGVWGLEVGFCLMIGGPRDAFEAVEPALATLAPPEGYALVGPAGAGHYAKMVHNGIEYGMLQAYAEGFDLLQASDFDLDLGQLAALWNHGSVVRSWLLELAERALDKDPKLESLAGYVDDSGEGRWTVLEAVERGVAADTLAHALFRRFTSREEDSFSMRMIAALRNEFGGHAVKQQ